LILTAGDVKALLDLDGCIAAVEAAFRAHGLGTAPPPGVLGIHVDGGGFHIKAGVLALSRPYFAAKVNANFPGNPATHGLPTIQGVLVLSDAARGTPLALMDAGEITAVRTAAATAVAVRHLAAPDARTAAVVGCGTQGRVQLRAVHRVRPLAGAWAYDQELGRAASFAAELSAELGIEVHVAATVRAAARAADIVVTCTPARAPILGPDDVRAGTFIAAVGADHPEKQELDPRLLSGATVVVDVLEQAATMGDLHHAIAAGVLTKDDVYAELGAIVAGKTPPRLAGGTGGATVVFDSTGMALQDVAAAALVYERAVGLGRGARLPLTAAPPAR
jgi:ornithine cyclodeaminase/alanine dehydrogenase-like protein (mu-crystallin family)